MKITHPICAHKDLRGEITDVMVKEPIEYVTVITSLKGASRGHHYHKETIQRVYVLRGRLKALSQFPDAPVQTAIIEEGDLLLSEPFERHALTALEDSTFVVFTRGPRGAEDYEKDTYRLAQPLEG